LTREHHAPYLLVIFIVRLADYCKIDFALLWRLALKTSGE
jgi:hypothetical protein